MTRAQRKSASLASRAQRKIPGCGPGYSVVPGSASCEVVEIGPRIWRFTTGYKIASQPTTLEVYVIFERSSRFITEQAATNGMRYSLVAMLELIEGLDDRAGPA